MEGFWKVDQSRTCLDDESDSAYEDVENVFQTMDRFCYGFGDTALSFILV